MIETEVTLPEGAVFEIEGKKYTVKDGVVIPMVEEEAEVEMAEEAPVQMMEEPKEEEVEMAAETEEPAAVEAVETPQGETYTKEEIDARFQEMMDIIAEMKAAAAPVEMGSPEEIASPLWSAVLRVLDIGGPAPSTLDGAEEGEWQERLEREVLAEASGGSRRGRRRRLGGPRAARGRPRAPTART